MRRIWITPPPPPVPVSKPRKLLTMERCLDVSVIVRDSNIGTGLIAKPVRRLSISYVSTLLSNSTIFDKNTGDSKGGNCGPPKLRMGMGEFIKGLDRGLESMRGGMSVLI